MILPAIVLNDYEGAHYATWVEEGVKTIETRMRTFSFTGDILICCGAKSVTPNARKALCIVHMGAGRPMEDKDVKAACIENAPGRIAYDLTNRRLLSYKFKFTDYGVKKKQNFQGIFYVRIPDFVKILTPESVTSTINH